MKFLRELGSVRLRPVRFDEFRIANIRADGEYGYSFDITGRHGVAARYSECDDMAEVRLSFEWFLAYWREGEEERASYEYYERSGIESNRAFPAAALEKLKAAIHARCGR